MLDAATTGLQGTGVEPGLFPCAEQVHFEKLGFRLCDGAHACPTDAEREELVLAHLQDVRQIARHIVRRLPSTVQFDDLVQSGTLGLIDAAKRFDHSRPLLFPQYARIRITGAIYDSLRDLDWASRHMRTRQQRLENTAVQLEKLLGRQPCSEEIAEAMEMDLDTFYEFASAVQEVQRVELDSQMDSAHSAGEQLLADAERAPDAVLFNKELHDYLRRAINDLPPHERTVMFLYYFREWRMAAIARHIRRTESRVSQIHSQAVARLRQRLKSSMRSSPSFRFPKAIGVKSH